MSKKSISISLPAKAPTAEWGSGPVANEWVHERDRDPDESIPGPDPMAFGRRQPLLLDLRAERGLAEVFALSAMLPFALGWFWMAHAMAGRVRF